MLDEAIADWRANHSFSAPGLMIAAATARSGVVLHANGWLDVECDRELAVRAVAEAVEMPVSAESVRIVTIALSVVLGETGRLAQGPGAHEPIRRRLRFNRKNELGGPPFPSFKIFNYTELLCV